MIAVLSNGYKYICSYIFLGNENDSQSLEGSEIIIRETKKFHTLFI